MNKKLALLFEFIYYLFKYKNVVVIGYTIDERARARYTTSCRKKQALEVINVLEQTIDKMNNGILKQQSQVRQEEGELVLNEIMAKWQQEQFKIE